MAFLRFLLLAAAFLTAVPAHGHQMGRTIPIVHSGKDITRAHLAAQVVAAYFEEQMGRDVRLVETEKIKYLFEQIVTRKAPMGIVPLLPADEIPADVVLLKPVLDTGAGLFFLVMGRDAVKDLRFSLVPRYMQQLSSRLTRDAWAKGIDRVAGGQGVRKVALEMLREADLL